MADVSSMTQWVKMLVGIQSSRQAIAEQAELTFFNPYGNFGVQFFSPLTSPVSSQNPVGNLRSSPYEVAGPNKIPYVTAPHRIFLSPYSSPNPAAINNQPYAVPANQGTSAAPQVNVAFNPLQFLGVEVY